LDEDTAKEIVSLTEVVIALTRTKRLRIKVLCKKKKTSAC